MKRFLTRHLPCLLLVLGLLFSAAACKKVKPTFVPYYAAHTPSAWETQDATLLSNTPRPDSDTQSDTPHLYYAIFAPTTGNSALDAAVTDFIHTEIAAAQSVYTEDAGLNLDYTLSVFLSKLGKILYTGFSCPISGKQTSGDPIAHAFFYEAESGTVYAAADLLNPEQRPTLNALINNALHAQTALEASVDDLSEDALLCALEFTEAGAVFHFAAGALGEAQKEELAPSVPFEDIAPCLADPVYRLFADYLPKRGREIDPDKPMIALTFDDGPSKFTTRIAELAEQYGGRVTFCVVGNRIEQFKDSLVQVSEAGHEIANHTWEHKKLTKLTYEEIQSQILRTSDKVRELTGKPTKFIRPTYGSVNDTLRQFSRDMKMPIANWEVDTLDWKSRDADSVYQICMSEVKDGDIVLFHDLYESTYHAIERIIPELAAKGYQFVTLSELVEYSGKDMVYGSIYRNAKA